ncbi:MAG: metallophosphoesterase [Planctomycetota bacterium]|nr:metallophosphoesterase [Planctomycetota bacterium]
MPEILYNLVLVHVVILGLVQLRQVPSGTTWSMGMVVTSIAACLFAGLGAFVAGIGLFGALGLLAWGVFAHIPLQFVAGALLLRTHRPRTASASILLAVGVLAIGADAFLIEPERLQLTRLEVVSRTATAPLRIAVLADIQTDEVGEHERRAVAMAMEQEPDLILLAGDYIQTDDPERGAIERRKLHDLFVQEGLAAPLGVFAVNGNTDGPQWMEIFEGLDVQLATEQRDFETAGLTVTCLPYERSFAPDVLVTPSEGFHVVLGHSPDFALGAVDADLLVAGHCHGGQVRLPLLGPLLILARIPRAWASGAHVIRSHTTLVVSRGIGMERGRAPRLRFLCPPEVVIIDVVPTVD